MRRRTWPGDRRRPTAAHTAGSPESSCGSPSPAGCAWNFCVTGDDPVPSPVAGPDSAAAGPAPDD